MTGRIRILQKFTNDDPQPNWGANRIRIHHVESRRDAVQQRVEYEVGVLPLDIDGALVLTTNMRAHAFHFPVRELGGRIRYR